MTVLLDQHQWDTLSITCIDDGAATVVFAEQNVLVMSICLEDLSYAYVIVQYDSICKHNVQTCLNAGQKRSWPLTIIRRLQT